MSLNVYILSHLPVSFLVSVLLSFTAQLNILPSCVYVICVNVCVFPCPVCVCRPEVDIQSLS